MMERRDLAWVTDPQGDVVAVGTVAINEQAQTVRCDVTVFENETLHLPPGINLPERV